MENKSNLTGKSIAFLVGLIVISAALIIGVTM